MRLNCSSFSDHGVQFARSHCSMPLGILTWNVVLPGKSLTGIPLPALMIGKNNCRRSVKVVDIEPQGFLFMKGGTLFDQQPGTQFACQKHQVAVQSLIQAAIFRKDVVDEHLIKRHVQPNLLNDFPDDGSK